MSSEIINLSLADSATLPLKPVFCDGRGSADGNERFTRGMKLRCVALGAATGFAEVYGLKFPNFDAELGSDYQSQVLGLEVHEGDGTETEFQTNLTYGAFSNYNWVVVEERDRGDMVVLEHGAGGGKFQVSDVGGKAKITVGTATTAGRRLSIALIAPAQCKLYDSETEQPNKQVAGANLVWALPVDDTGYTGHEIALEPLTS